jgi:dihydrofolate reductase
MGTLIESNHVSLDGSPQWAFPYLNEEHNDYAKGLLFAADALLLGRATYEGLSVVTLMEHGLIDELHLLLTPVAVGRGQRLFESVDAPPRRPLSLRTSRSPVTAS